MSRRKKPVHKVVMMEGKRQIIANLLSEYDIKSANDMILNQLMIFKKP